MDFDFSPAILRNKGVPVAVHRLSGDDYARDSDGNALEEVRNLRFTGADVASLEEMFDGTLERVKVPHLKSDGSPYLSEAGEPVIGHYENFEEKLYGAEAFQESMSQRPTKTVCQVLAMAWNISEKAAGKMLISSEIQTYPLAVNMAWSIANGVDPEAVGKMMSRSAEMLKRERDKANQAMIDGMDEMLQEKPSDGPGPSGSPSGSKRMKLAVSTEQ